MSACRPPADPTYRLPNAANLAKRWTPQAAFRFALPGPQVRCGGCLQGSSNASGRQS